MCAFSLHFLFKGHSVTWFVSVLVLTGYFLNLYLIRLLQIPFPKNSMGVCVDYIFNGNVTCGQANDKKQVVALHMNGGMVASCHRTVRLIAPCPLHSSTRNKLRRTGVFITG